MREDGRRYTLAFTERRTKRNLLVIAQANGGFLLGLLGDWDSVATYTKAGGWVFGPLTIKYSGRTERDVASEQDRIH